MFCKKKKSFTTRSLGNKPFHTFLYTCFKFVQDVKKVREHVTLLCELCRSLIRKTLRGLAMGFLLLECYRKPTDQSFWL